MKAMEHADGYMLRMCEAAGVGLPRYMDGMAQPREAPPPREGGADDMPWPEFQLRNAFATHLLACEWVKAGRPRFVLTDSMAALLLSTKSPAIEEDAFRTPFDSFMIEVPGEWTGMSGTGPLHIFVQRCEYSNPDRDADQSTLILATRIGSKPGEQVMLHCDGGDTFSEDLPGESWLLGGMGESPDAFRKETGASNAAATCAEVIRYALNACLFINQHNDTPSVKPRTSKGKRLHVIDVRPPVDIKVTSDFRRLARGLLANVSEMQRSQCVMHMVRGHWRNQACGEQRASRKMIWVAPHQRGAESLGRVVERAVVLHQ